MGAVRDAAGGRPRLEWEQVETFGGRRIVDIAVNLVEEYLLDWLLRWPLTPCDVLCDVHDRASQMFAYLGDNLVCGVVGPQESKRLRKVVGGPRVIPGEVRAVNGGADNLFDLGNSGRFAAERIFVVD